MCYKRLQAACGIGMCESAALNITHMIEKDKDSVMILLVEGNSFVRLFCVPRTIKFWNGPGCKNLSVYSNHYLGLSTTKSPKLFSA